MFQLFACNFERDISFQKLQNGWVAKAIISLYILCKKFQYSNRGHREYLTYRAQIFSESYWCHDLFISRIDI